MTPLFRKFLGLNWLLFANMALLIVFGISAIYSASWIREQDDLALKWRDQIYWVLAGMAVFFTASLLDYKWIRYLGIPFYLGALGLVIYTTYRGAEINYTRAWIDFGAFMLQPSQLAIAGGIMAMALALSTLHRIHPVLRNPFLRLAVTAVIAVIPFVFVLKQGDFGSALVWIPVCAAMVLVGNIPFRYLVTVVLAASMFVPFVFHFYLKDYQQKRITVQIDMLQGRQVDILNEAYSAYHNLLAIGSGGWTGKGFKNPDTVNNKGFISPDTAINDFIFAVIAEEHGFRGSLLMLGGFALLILQCVYVAFYSRDLMGRLLVAGVAGLLFAHVYQNVGMNLLLMPITGIPLPFISYGGTFMVTVLMLMGLVQSVWVHRGETEAAGERPRLRVEHLD